MDFHSSALNSVTASYKNFLNDLEALPEDVFTKKFGEKTRTVADIVYEVLLVNDHVGMVMRGEEPFPWPDDPWIYAPAEFNNKEAIIEAVKASSDKIVGTIKAFTPEQIMESLETEHGPSTRFQRCQFINLHMWYHGGQLNFIQSMLGDDVWHWN